MPDSTNSEPAEAMPRFSILSELYDALVDWPKRLAREEPFFRTLFEQAGAQSIVDVACGTGRHAAMFHDWGLRVEAADLNPSMIELARRRFGEPPGLCWVVRGFDQSISSAPFDVSLCIGNSLALTQSHEHAAAVVRQMHAATRPGGRVLIHVLNLGRLPDGPCVWQTIKPAVIAGRKWLLAKGVHRCGNRGFVDFVAVPAGGEEPPHTESIPILQIEAAELQQMAYEAGADTVVLHGSYQSEPYASQTSIDMIMVSTPSSQAG